MSAPPESVAVASQVAAVAGSAQVAPASPAVPPVAGEASEAVPEAAAAASVATSAIKSADVQAKRSKVKHTEAQLKELLQRRLKEKESLQQLETQIYAMEGGYLQDTQLWGNVFRGWDGYTSTKSQGRTRRFKESDRLFSSSSLTAPSRKVTDDDEDDAERRKRKKDKRMLEKKKRMRVESDFV
eukprot:m.31410 g.31410  ORF g.31410 m.31410 type:complete len:184 (-) comp12313_c0_seq1:228-779(-)